MGLEAGTMTGKGQGSPWICSLLAHAYESDAVASGGKSKRRSSTYHRV
jgi:hypothetical protein